MQDSLDYAVSELTTYKNLASLGMLASEFGHETSDILNRVKTSVPAVIRNIRKIEGLDSSVALLDVVKKDFMCFNNDRQIQYTIILWPVLGVGVAVYLNQCIMRLVYEELDSEDCWTIGR